jgi:16S rRNA (guanine966-N2)-methyltransferase
MKYLKGASVKFDLVFVDPPYEFSNWDLEVLLELLTANVSDHGLVVVERSSRSEATNCDVLELQSTKTYGDTAVWIYEKP